MTTNEDLYWWLSKARTLTWQWAKTYADSAPHYYVVEPRTERMRHDDYVRAARVIHTFGQPGSYYGITNIYLEDPENQVKWWTMDADVTVTNLINRATTARLYGVQTAPSTFSGVVTPYDAIATSYDLAHPFSKEVASALRSAVREVAGKYPVSMLDVGCGTGRVLDLGLARPERYAGVDPSTPMLNQLVRKHPNVARLYPMTIERALEDGIFTPLQFEIVTMIVDEEDGFTPQVIDSVRSLASRAFIHVRGDDIDVRRVERPEHPA